VTERDQIRAEIKRRLNSYRDILTEHAQLAEELQRVEALMASPSSPNMDGMPRCGSGPSNPTERAAIKHMELVDRYKKQIRQMIEEQAAIETMIEGLEPTERKLARFRYIDGLTWEDVCEKMVYSWRQTHRIHGRMLDNLVTKALENQ
jgi:DNA-directed RNA polymerase specialized sigma subunit